MSAEPLPKHAQDQVVRTHLHGIDLLLNSRLNKGTAFTQEERDEFALHGLLPPHIGTLEDQRERRMRVLHGRETGFLKYSNMRDLQDNCETLFYSLIAHHTEELLPIVYTPTVGEGCQRFSEIWRKPRGLFLSYPNKSRIDQILSDRRYDKYAASWSATASASSAWATRALEAWAFPSGKWRSIQRWAAFRRSIACPCCSMSARTTKPCSKTRFTSAGSTSGCAGRSMTILFMPLSPP